MPSQPPTAAIKWCQQMTRQHSHTFYRGSLLYPPLQREAVWAVYAACRIGDDITDSGRKDAQQALDHWWQQVQGAAQGQTDDTMMTQALAWTFEHYPVPLEAFAELYAGFSMDLSGHHYQTLSDLQLYCRRVAGVVGFMIAPIGGYQGGDKTLQAALLLGQAMQLTNILRDVGEDLRLGRVYLPAELLLEYGVTLTDLQASHVTPQYKALLQHLESIAREWYLEGLKGLPDLQGRARYGVAVAARLYAGILDELRKNDYNNLSQRAYVSGRRKLWLMAHELHERQPYPHLCPINWAGRQYARLRSAR